MNLLQKTNELKQQINLLYNGEIQIAQHRALLEHSAGPGELGDFLDFAADKNRKVLKRLEEMLFHLAVNGNGEKDETIQSILTELAGTLSSQKENREMIQSAISIYCHSIAGYQVNLYKAAMLQAAELINFDVTRLLWECLKDKKAVKQEINFLEEKLLIYKEKEFSSASEFACA